jgi:hypothetical protein
VNVGRAFNYVFDDNEWVGKLAIVALLTLAIPIGLVSLAVLFGYLVELVRYVRSGYDVPLPKWDDYGKLFSAGLNVLAAFIVYNLPNLLLACGIWLFSGSSVGIVTLCCLVPLLLIVNAMTWPVLAVGTIRYAESQQSGEFYRLGEIYAMIQAHLSVVFAWFIVSVLSNLALAAIALIPCLGWAVFLGMSIPIQAHLLGQLGRQLGAKEVVRRR